MNRILVLAIFASMLIVGIIINYIIWDFFLFNYERPSWVRTTAYLILASVVTSVMSMIGGAGILNLYRNRGNLK